MSLSVGIVGLPNVGKSTLFNALLKKQQALAANYPFATVEPNVGVVPVPDGRLAKLAQAVKKSEGLENLPPEIPATVTFIDIAGLMKGAHKGEGLGNKFLSHIRETDAIAHVLRDFSDRDVVREGSVSPEEDLRTVDLELVLADMATLEKQREPKGAVSKEDAKRWELVSKLRKTLERGMSVIDAGLDEEEMVEAKQLGLLTAKSKLVVINIDETDLKRAGAIEREHAVKLGLNENQVVAISAKLESQLSELTEAEQKEMLGEYGVDTGGLEKLAGRAFATLGLITFLTAGEKEVRAWTIPDGSSAQEAAGVIHTDFAKNFIKANVVGFEDFVKVGGWRGARDKGLMRSEGRDYVVRDGEVIEFMIGK